MERVKCIGVYSKDTYHWSMENFLKALAWEDSAESAEQVKLLKVGETIDTRYFIVTRVE